MAATVAVAFVESVTVTVKAKLPVAGGVPLRVPAAVSVSQFGSPEADHE